VITAFALAAAIPVIGSAEQVWMRCSYERLLTRLRYEAEHNLWSEPAALASWAFVECSAELKRFAQQAPPSTVEKSVRRERRELENSVKLDQHGRTLRDI
jgi:hypothetical protein